MNASSAPQRFVGIAVDLLQALLDSPTRFAGDA